MSERDRQINRDVDVDVDIPGDVIEEPASERSRGSEASRGDRVRTRIREGAGSVLSAQSLLVSLALTLGGVVLLGGLLPLGTIGDLIGIAVAGFLYGVVATPGRYVELTLAGGAVGGGSALLGNFVLSLLGPGIPIVLFGLVAGALSGVVGHYFGRDLRDGLTREI